MNAILTGVMKTALSMQDNAILNVTLAPGALDLLTLTVTIAHYMPLLRNRLTDVYATKTGPEMTVVSTTGNVMTFALDVTDQTLTNVKYVVKTHTELRGRRLVMTSV